MAVKWVGRLRGTLPGYKIFVLIIKRAGIAPAYFLLAFVAFYFVVFSHSHRLVIYRFYYNKLNYDKLKSVWFTYKNFFVFGQTIIDRVAIFSNAKANFTYHFNGQPYLEQMITAGKGGMLISAHIGNFEVSGHFLQRLHANMNLVTSQTTQEKIEDYLNSVMAKQNHRLIYVQKDMTHIFEINQAINNNELICFTGDRSFDKAKVVRAEFLGQKADFPAGPFHLVTRFKIPYSFVFNMKGRGRSYNFYATPAKVNEGSIESMVEEYAKVLEAMIRKYPEQWFNYYDFWTP